MKLTITIVLMVIATTHLMFAEDPGVQDPSEKEQDPSLYQSREPISDEKSSSIDLQEIAQSIKPFTRNKKVKKIKWSKGMFSKVVKRLGILSIPGVKLVKVRKSFVRKLMKAKNHMIEMHTGRRVTRGSSIHSNKQYTKPRKRNLHDLCAEFADDLFVLAHEDQRLAYQIETIRCEGGCNYDGNAIGECVLKKKTMVVFVIDLSNNLHQKTVEAGCACECFTYSLK